MRVVIHRRHLNGPHETDAASAALRTLSNWQLRLLLEIARSEDRTEQFSGVRCGYAKT